MARQAQRLTRAPEESKARILDAAQIAFGTVGYARSGVREIAEAAGVAPSLVIHYFGSKEALFAEAFSRSVKMTAALSVARDEFGANALELLSEEQTDTVRAAAMLAQSIGDPAARSVAGGLMEQAVLGPMADWFGAPHARGRAQLVAMLTLGFTAFRLLVPQEGPEAEDDSYVSAWMARTLQRLAEGKDEA
jgi:AcrR family transcriptional regulator